MLRIYVCSSGAAVGILDPNADVMTAPLIDSGAFVKSGTSRSYRTDPNMRDTVILTAGTTHGGREVERIVPERCARFQTCDPAASTSKDADYFVLSTWLVTPRANVVWWGCHRNKYEIQEALAACQRLYRQYQPQFLAVERVLNQTALYQLTYRSQNPHMVVIPVTPRGQNKADHAGGFISLAGTGRVFLPERASAGFCLDAVTDELMRFTGLPKQDDHDDIIDTGSYMAEMLPMVRPGHNGSGSKPPVKHTSKAAPWSGLR